MDLNNLEARIAAAHGANLVMALDPNEMYELVALLKRQEAEHLATHRKLAAETLRADQGWQRYEEANADRNALRAARAILAAQPAAAAPDAQPDAWMTEDERVVHASTMAGAKKDGGALLSSMRPFNIALYRHAAAQPEAKAAPAQAEAIKKPTGDQTATVGEIASTATMGGSPATRTAFLAGEPAMGEELPLLPAFHAMGLFNADQMHVYGRACMALRQPGATHDELVAAEDKGSASGYRVGLLEGASLIREVLTNHVFHTGLKGLEDRCKQAEEVLLTKADSATAPVSQPAAQEPVAYAIFGENGNVRIWFSDRDASVRWAQRNHLDPAKLQALYTAPQPLSAPAGSEQEGGAA